MKKAFTFLFVFTCLCAGAQYHGAENNYYTFSEKDSVTTTTNYVPMVFKNGKVLYWPYGGMLHLLGNNYKQKAPPPLNGAILHPSFFRLNDSSVWVTQSNKAYLLTADNIIDSFTSKGHIYLSNSDNSQVPVLWFSYKLGDTLRIASYTNGKIKEWGEPPFKLDIYHAFWKNEKGNLLLGKPNEYCELSENGFGPVQKSLLPPFSYYNLSGPFASPTIVAKTIENSAKLLRIHKNIVRQVQTPSVIKDISILYDNVAVINYTDNSKEIMQFTDSNETVIGRMHHEDVFSNISKAGEGSFYLGGQNKMTRLFTYIKKYPNLFEGNNSSNIFSVQQDATGNIWAGSYRGYLSRIQANGMHQISTKNIFISNGGCVIGDKVYLVGEGFNNGLLQFSENGKFRKLTKNITGFINYVDSGSGKLYFGTSGKGLWYTAINKLNDREIKWDVISHEQGLSLPNIVTITKDKVGRFWLGQPSTGWAVYNPATKRAQTRLIKNGETEFGLMSSFMDDRGTVWLGSKQKGLLYYNNYRSNEVAVSDIQSINHPLLVNGKIITAIKQWGNWLIFGATDNYLAMDLNAWYTNKKVLVRYLNPQEAAFTGTTEQNTLLVDKRDSTLWFSTSDMLYQWDFKKWLSLPQYTVTPNLILHVNGYTIDLHEKKSNNLEPVENNLTVAAWFQSPDNMPRYLSVALIKKGETLQFSPPGLLTHFTFINLPPGKYIIAVQICQLDGSVTVHQFPITINNFWWQIWAWALAFAGFTAIVLYIQNIRRKKKVAEEIAKTKAAELETVKAKQAKELANLQVVALSSQFRPHFILNALNTIGAQMDDKPEAESVLSRLGESINLIFNHSQQQQIAHSFANEWLLVKNIIHIHRLMYLKNLEAELPDEEIITTLGDMKLPLGLLQIPVENALIHGLCNKEKGPWHLQIAIENNSETVTITITDNGVGRKNAATLSNYRKHGTGTKNLAGILEILNANNKQKISFDYQDEIFTDNQEKFGTKAIIIIPINFMYES